jgi:hypothetical protein
VVFLEAVTVSDKRHWLQALFGSKSRNYVPLRRCPFPFLVNHDQLGVI